MRKKRCCVFKSMMYRGKLMEFYWTGEMTDKGDPATTNSVRKAKEFGSTRRAYDAAGSTGNMDWWKAGWRAREVFH